METGNHEPSRNASYSQMSLRDSSPHRSNKSPQSLCSPTSARGRPKPCGRSPTRRRHLGKIGSLFSCAFRDHEPGKRIFGELLQDVTISTLCGRQISGLELLRGLPGHRAQLLIPIANLYLRIVALTKREQLIDHELGLAALHLNPLDRPRKYIGLRMVVNAVADADRGAKQLVDAFEAGGNVHTVAQGGVAQPVRRTDIADKDLGAIESDPQVDSWSFFRLP